VDRDNLPAMKLHALVSRTLLLVIGSALMTGCASPEPGDQLLRELEKNQFLKYAGANAVKMRAEIREKGWPAIFSDSGRIFNADGLSLAKGGVTAFIEKLRPFLEGQGVKIPALKDDLKQESYTLLIEGSPLPIWTRDDLTRELGLQPGITGGLAAARSFALVNKLLEDAKSPERAYAIYSGAALSVMFLTDEIVAVMKADENAVPKFMPYRLTTDFPFFGQPQE
jgi:hypothetical protein